MYIYIYIGGDRKTDRPTDREKDREKETNGERRLWIQFCFVKNIHTIIILDFWEYLQKKKPSLSPEKKILLCIEFFFKSKKKWKTLKKCLHK